MRQRVETDAVAHVRQALDNPTLPVLLDFTIAENPRRGYEPARSAPPNVTVSQLGTGQRTRRRRGPGEDRAINSSHFDHVSYHPDNDED